VLPELLLLLLLLPRPNTLLLLLRPLELVSDAAVSGPWLGLLCFTTPPELARLVQASMLQLLSSLATAAACANGEEEEATDGSAPELALRRIPVL